jgi:tetratricopeptide (TPR) repeat protein
MSQPLPSATLDARLLRFRHDPSSEDPFLLAQALLVANRAVDALEVTGVAARVQPSDGRMWTLDGRARLQQGDLIRAQSSLLKAARLAPDDSEVFRWLGEVLLRRGDPERASKVLERAIGLAPDRQELRELYERAMRLVRVESSPQQARPVWAPPAGSASSAHSPSTSDAVTAATSNVTPFDDDAQTSVREYPALAHDLAHDDGPSTARRSMPAVADDEPVTSAYSTAAGKAPRAYTDQTQPKVKHDVPLVPRASGPQGVQSHAANVANVASEYTPQKPLWSRPAPAPSTPSTPPMTPAFTAPTTPTASGPNAAVRVKVEVQKSPRVTVGPGDVSALMSDHAADESVVDFLHSQAYARAPSHALPASAASAALSGASDAGPSEWEQVQRIAFWRTSTGRVLLSICAAAVVLVGVGYWQWTEWVARRHRAAAALVQQARLLARNGSHEALVNAERQLTKARSLNRHQRDSVHELLFVQTQRALEEGSFEPGFLRATLDLAKRNRVTGPLPKAAAAVVSVSEGVYTDARNVVHELLAVGSQDARLLYLAGRLQQRLDGSADSTPLQHAMALKDPPAAAFIAHAEQLYDEGRQEESVQVLRRVTDSFAGHLRAVAWLAFLRAEDESIPTVQQELSLLEKQTPKMAATDRVLFGLAKVRLLKRRNDESGRAEAKSVIDSLLGMRLTDPRLLALIARETETIGMLAALGVAQEASLRAVHLAPNNPQYRKLAADIALRQQDPQRALQLVQSLPDDDPDVLWVHALAALDLGGAEGIQQAARSLDDWIRRNRDPDVRFRTARARLMVASADAAQSQQGLRELRGLATESNDEEVLSALADAELRLRNYEAAKKLYAQLLVSNPARADYHYGRAMAELGGDPPQSNGPTGAVGAMPDVVAVESGLKRALELSPGLVKAHVALGDLRLRLGRLADADAAYSQAAPSARVLGGVSISTIANLGRARVKIAQGDAKGAMQLVLAVPENEARHPEVRLVLARAQLAAGRYDAAQKELKTLLDKGVSPTADMRVAMAEALIGMKQWDRAHDALKQALEKDPSYPEALITRAKLAVHDNRAGAALEYLDLAQRALQRRVRPARMHAEVVLFTGRIRLSQSKSDWEIAVKLFQKATEMPDAPSESQFLLGEAFAKTGKQADAKKAYQRYLELDPDGAWAAQAKAKSR